jgi:polysaccharide deacetylase family protein (PEP-CTERM system associated)
MAGLGIEKEDLVNALTVDVEDAVSLAMRNFFKTEMEPTINVYDNTMRLLDLFSEFSTSATFFILGEVAKTYPELIKEIARRGHELGIHGYSHVRYDTLSREKVKEEIVRAKKTVEDISGIRVIGHRAPEFSIGQKNVWVLDILLDAGIKYDSSIFPVRAARYGWPGFNKNIDWFTVDDGRKIIEAPLSTVSCFVKEIPACGGGYLRAFPYVFTHHAFMKISNNRPVIIYLHPYEVDLPPFQGFYMDAVSRSTLKNKLQLKAYWFNRKSVIPKLEKLLTAYKFDTLESIIANSLKTKLRD